jgi:hypothetical protein
MNLKYDLDELNMSDRMIERKMREFDELVSSFSNIE